MASRFGTGNHQVMVNGTGLLGNSSTTQAAMIMPKPGDPTNYYVFTPDAAGLENGLHYSEIDMDAAGGLGAVINKNLPLVTPVCEKVAATFHANGTDIWITTHHWGTNAYYSYLVTSAGVNQVPVISNAGAEVSGANNSGRYAGYMAFSPDGSHLAALHHNVAIELLDFDPSTGIISNPRAVKEGMVQGYGVEFSPSGNLLYITSGFQVLQYQVNVPDIPATEVLLATTANIHGSIKTGPDSKVYIITRSLHPSISVINNPDVPGTGCNFVYDQVNLGGRATFSGLPSFLTSPLYITGLNFDNECAGSEVSFSMSSTIVPDEVNWDFGDGNFSSQANPTHVYLTAGTYTVKATARKGMFVRYFTKTIIISPTPVANQPQDIIVCDDESNDGAENFDLSLKTPEILGTQSPVNFTVTYHLTQQEAEAGTNPVTGTFINSSNPQPVYARVTGNQGVCAATTSFSIIIQPKPVINMNDEYFVCNENILVLTAPAGFDAYQWSTGETTRTIFAGTGTYTLTVTKNYGNITCNASKTITVTRSGIAEIKEIKINDWTDNNNSLTVIAEGTGDYEYSVDGVTYQANPVFYNLLPGLYTVYVRDRNGCGIAEEETVLLMYPRFFTPNEDGYNDVWRIKYSDFEPEMIVHVYDRYGKIVNSFTGSNSGWDGTFNGRSLPSTDYWFVVKRKDGREHKGHFSMIR
jgi:gliding motility-associated-like protein